MSRANHRRHSGKPFRVAQYRVPSQLTAELALAGHPTWEAGPMLMVSLAPLRCSPDSAAGLTG